MLMADKTLAKATGSALHAAGVDRIEIGMTAQELKALTYAELKSFVAAGVDGIVGVSVLTFSNLTYDLATHTINYNPVITSNGGGSSAEISIAENTTAVTPSRIKENIEVFDFSLDYEDLAAISALNEDRRIGSHPADCDASTNVRAPRSRAAPRIASRSATRPSADCAALTATRSSSTSMPRSPSRIPRSASDGSRSTWRALGSRAASPRSWT